jgi:hypothetical protein
MPFVATSEFGTLFDGFKNLKPAIFFDTKPRLPAL